MLVFLSKIAILNLQSLQLPERRTSPFPSEDPMGGTARRHLRTGAADCPAGCPATLTLGRPMDRSRRAPVKRGPARCRALPEMAMDHG